MEDHGTPPLLTLPSELIHHVLSYLPLSDLISIGTVNRALHDHSLQDTLWRPLVQANVHGVNLTHPHNSTWREVFKTHHPYWFIPKNKIWFADNTHTGKLLIARYNPSTNAIEGFALGAERRQPTFTTWDWNPEAIIHTFSPRIQLDLNAPIIRLDANAYARAVGESPNRLQKELPMDLYNEPAHATAGLYSRLMLTRPWPQHIIGKNTPVWPPLRLPSTVRTRNDSASQFRGLDHRPSKIQELSNKTFRIRKWMEFSSRASGISMRVGEDITTWATLPEECYTPTAQKPWQGIWCGDYAGHGCEFLAVIQPDNPEPLPERAEWVMRARERTGSVSSSESWSTAPMEATSDDESSSGMSMSSISQDAELEDSVESENGSTYRGRIEAIKLTGDPNIPRGEYTFIAPDIGPNGLVRVATEDMFKGARIVKSVGHIAARGFREDDFMASQLILISHDRLAQYWETFGHVSFYQRVNLDEFTKVS
ncbi:F-box domain-containing protein [Amniculicola lignicola CBS 123094]|uniref:F-box domain-containing protein n=1 Tax=Amniculicola lignicola CBS 123094 TaxID=1392246 RepID=A0A6A5WFI7_9PLEO|nr:F-box domain-containing protein [Amniculicola lignicola CBS 123094]